MKIIKSTLLLFCIWSSHTFAQCKVLSMDIVKCGSSFGPTDCGSNPPATDPLRGGVVTVSCYGDIRVLLKGAAPDTDYTIYVGNWVRGSNGFQFQYSGDDINGSVGVIRTNRDGDYSGRIKSSGKVFKFEKGTKISQINFAFNNPALSPTQFSTGIDISR